MTYSRAGALLVLSVLIVFGSARPTLAVEVSRHPDKCQVLATTGKSEAGRDPESRATCARVDNRPPRHSLRPPEKKHELPIDRLRSFFPQRFRGEAMEDRAARLRVRVPPVRVAQLEEGRQRAVVVLR